MVRANQDIRALAKQKGVQLWRVAVCLGLHDSNFSRMLRHELTPTERTKISRIIDMLSERRAVEEGDVTG